MDSFEFQPKNDLFLWLSAIMLSCAVCGATVTANHENTHAHREGEARMQAAKRTLFVSNPPKSTTEETLIAALCVYAGAAPLDIESVFIEPQHATFALVTWMRLLLPFSLAFIMRSNCAFPFLLVRRPQTGVLRKQEVARSS